MYMVAIIKRGAIGNGMESRLAPAGRYRYHLRAMEPRSLPTDGAVAQPASNSRWWLVVFLGLLAWQGWMTLTLFGTDGPWQRMLDEEPIISGAHPLHLYFGWLGASSLYERGSIECYDPAFQAGFPKTPVFDSGSRPAELFLAVAGGTNQPAAYKVGLAICCMIVPLLLMIGARSLGLRRGPACLSVAVSLLVWWGEPGREALEAGDLDLLLGGICAVAVIGLLIRFDWAPGLFCWIGLLGVGSLGWFAHPFLFLLLVPLLLVYYLSVGARHPLGWHAALLAAQAGALGLNSFWLVEWVRSWWLRLPVQLHGEPLLHRTFHTLWKSSLWGEPADRGLAVALCVGAALGIAIMNQRRQRAAARLLGMGAGGLLLLALAGISWPSLGRLGTSHLLVPGLWFAVPPAVYAGLQVALLFGGVTGAAWRGACLAIGLILVTGVVAHRQVATLALRCLGTSPLAIGLGPERQHIVDSLRSNTSAAARILWQESSGPREAPRWTALLPLLIERPMIGGLGPDVSIEHAYAGLVDQNLAGRPIADWSGGDDELNQFCRRYNIGWVVCSEPQVVAHFRKWNGAREMAIFAEGGRTATLFALEPHSFILTGKAEVLQADSHCIALANVVPDRDGRVVLAFHYQAGLQVSPSRVQIEREPDPSAQDPIPFIRLVMPAPVSHLTIRWNP
jgi:hypothetical protein